MHFRVGKLVGKKKNISKISYLQVPTMADAMATASKIPGEFRYAIPITHEEYLVGKMKSR